MNIMSLQIQNMIRHILIVFNDQYQYLFNRYEYKLKYKFHISNSFMIFYDIYLQRYNSIYIILKLY